MEPGTIVELGTHEQSQENEVKSDQAVVLPTGTSASETTNEDTKTEIITSDGLMLELRKYILLLATLVATVTYAAGFNPPGGVWQDTDGEAGHLAGDPILLETHHARYLVFFYCNATAFASSLVVIVLLLLLAVLYVKEEVPKNTLLLLRAVMVLELLSAMVAYAAGTCRDTPTTVYSSVLVAGTVVYLVVQTVWAWIRKRQRHGGVDGRGLVYEYNKAGKRVRKVLMLLAMFAVSVTYIAGMSTPGGFWDDDGAGEGHRPGDAILKDRHGARLTAFLYFNTTSFVWSVLIIMVLVDWRPRLREAYACIVVALVSLVGAYTAGSCRDTDTTVYVVSLVGAVLVFIVSLQAVRVGLWRNICRQRKQHHGAVISGNAALIPLSQKGLAVAANADAPMSRWSRWLQGPLSYEHRRSADKARSLVLLLATLAATITYQAGLDPPGGVWPDNGDGHMAGDPILLTTNPWRYKAFFYCNSVAFVASLVAIILVQNELMLRTHVLEAAMILDLFGLIGAYAAGSCRDVNTSIYAMALAGVVLVYVVIHVVFFTLDDHSETNTVDAESDDLVEKRRKRLLLFAVLTATITYQAGLTPPGGFRLDDDDAGDGSSGHRAGDPVLLYFHRRYTAFFYCNSVSFMLSIALIILLVNPHLYRPAIRSYALAVCTAAGLFGLMGAYAAGSTQYLKTSFYIFALVAVVLLVIAVLVLVFVLEEKKKSEMKKNKEKTSNSNGALAQSPSSSGEPSAIGTVNDEEEKKKKKEKIIKKKKKNEQDELYARRKYLMLLGILVASVTYQAGLKPPGGAWQSSGGWYDAGNPVMHDNRRPRYLAFFYSNSTSFVASIVVIMLLLPEWLHGKKWSLRVMNTTIVLDLLALLGAYAAGSSRGWKTSVYVFALVIAVLAYVAIHVALAFSCYRDRSGANNEESQGGQENALHSQRQGNVEDPAQVAQTA